MGMLSVIVIRNDHLHVIREDQDFGRKVAGAIAQFPFLHPQEYGPMRGDGFVVSVGDADYEQIVSVRNGRGAPLPADEMEALHRFRSLKERRAKRAAKNGTKESA